MIDTCAWEAIYDKSDDRHSEAMECIATLERNPPNYIHCTTLTAAETHRRLLYKKRLGYQTALNFIEKFPRNTPLGTINVIRPDDDDEKYAVDLLKRFPDQDLTFNDAISMAVMLRFGIVKAFTFDRHFELLGFQRIPYA